MNNRNFCRPSLNNKTLALQIPAHCRKFATAIRSGSPAALSSSSRLQREVTATLRELSVRLMEEVLIEEGYRIDVRVLWEGTQIAIEVDGPTQWLNGEGV